MRPPARLRSTALVAAVLAGLGAGLGGCGDPEPDPYAVPEQYRDYCDEVEVQRAAIGEALAGGATTGLIDALPSFRALAQKAPDDVEEEWGTVVSRAEGLAAALESAGVEPGDYDRQHPPKGLTRAERRAIDDAATALGAPATADAMSQVQQHARDVCKTPLAL